MTETEIAAQHVLDAAGAQAAQLHAHAIARLPRWRRWLLRRLSPPYPCIPAQLPPGKIFVTKPLEAPPGVSVSGAWIERA